MVLDIEGTSQHAFCVCKAMRRTELRKAGFKETEGQLVDALKKFATFEVLLEAGQASY